MKRLRESVSDKETENVQPSALDIVLNKAQGKRSKLTPFHWFDEVDAACQAMDTSTATTLMKSFEPYMRSAASAFRIDGEQVVYALRLVLYCLMKQKQSKSIKNPLGKTVSPTFDDHEPVIYTLNSN